MSKGEDPNTTFTQIFEVLSTLKDVGASKDARDIYLEVVSVPSTSDYAHKCRTNLGIGRIIKTKAERVVTQSYSQISATRSSG